jgi:hypothetical protein
MPGGHRAGIHYSRGEARGAGWTPLEACLALTELADNCVLGDAANERTKKQIRDLIGRYYKRRPGES